MTNTEIQEIIIDNSAYIYAIINKYRSYADIEDLYQVAIMGIMKASKNYDKSYNVKFTTYAYQYIIGEINEFINKNRSIKLSKDYLKIYKQIVTANNLLAQRLMKEPTTFELAVFLEIDESIIINVLNAVSQADSLDRTICSDGKNLSLYDTIEASHEDIDINQILLHEEINKLDPDSRRLIEERYFHDKTQSETAQILGINQVQVSRNEKKILKLLKSNIHKPL